MLSPTLPGPLTDHRPCHAHSPPSHVGLIPVLDLPCEVGSASATDGAFQKKISLQPSLPFAIKLRFLDHWRDSMPPVSNELDSYLRGCTEKSSTASTRRATGTSSYSSFPERWFSDTNQDEVMNPKNLEVKSLHTIWIWTTS